MAGVCGPLGPRNTHPGTPVMSADDKRKYRRVKSEFTIRIKKSAVVEDANLFSVAKSVNISGNGILFSYSMPMDIGATIQVTFLKPNTFDFFEGSAKVVRVELQRDGVYDIGVELLNLTEADEKKLNYYVTKDE
mgnify:CR=1 FL=1